MIWVYIILTLLLTLMLHELGHILAMAWINGEFPEIKIGWREIVVEDGNKESSKIVYFMGIVGGLLPLIGLFWFSVPVTIVLIILYLFGCKYDIKKMLRRDLKCH